MAALQHQVTLVALNGREKDVQMRISLEGVQLLSAADGKEFNNFPFAVIKKWLPAHMRSRNPGPEDCLDLQIQTDKGIRDLRMRCRGTNEVLQVIDELRDTVNGIVQQLVVPKEMMSPSREQDTYQNRDTTQYRQQANTSHGQVEFQSSPGPHRPYENSYDGQSQQGQHDRGQPAQHRYHQDVGYGPASVSDQERNYRADTSGDAARRYPTMPASAQDLERISGAVPVTVLGALPGPLHDPARQQSNTASTQPVMLQPQLASPARPGNATDTGAGVASYQPTHAHLSPGRPQQVYQAQQQQAGANMTHSMSSSPTVHRPTPIATSGVARDSQYNSPTITFGAAPAAQLPSMISPGGGVSTEHDEQMRQHALDMAMAQKLTPRKEVLAAGRSAQVDMQITAMQHEIQDLLEQNKFLESMVKRLTSELAKRQAAGDMTAGKTEAADMYEDDGTPLPVWLKDRRYLNPLLLAYDQRMADLEEEAAQRKTAFARLQEQVNAVIAENDALRAELGKSIDNKAMLAALAEGTAAAKADNATAMLREEVHLLRQENELLVAQQSELDGEIQRLHAQMQDQTSQAVTTAQQNAVMMARMKAAVEGAQEWESQKSRLQSALSAAEAKVVAYSQQLAQAQTQLEDERIAAETATRTLATLQSAQAELKGEAETCRQAAREATDKQAIMQVELQGYKDRYKVVSEELALSRKEVESLRSSLSTTDARLVDYQARDAQAFTRIREAVEAAEKARNARDSALSRQAELEKEVDSLTQRLAGVRQAVRDQVYSELQASIHALKAELETTREQLKSSDMQAAEDRSIAERLAREVDSLHAELNALRADYTETLSSKSKASMMALGTLERVQQLERERDEAAQKLESVTRQIERSQRDWDLVRAGMETELRSLRKSLAERDNAATLSTSQASGLQRQMDALTAELVALRDAKSRSEQELRQQVSAARAERDLEVKAMAARLEGAMAACAKSVAEAEKLLEGKDALLARWKEEANLVATKMERALTEHQKELEARETTMEQLRAQVNKLQSAHTNAVNELEELRGILPGLQGALQESEARGAQLHMQVLASNTREEELMQEVRSLQSFLERARFEAARAGTGPQVERAGAHRPSTHHAQQQQHPPRGSGSGYPAGYEMSSHQRSRGDARSGSGAGVEDDIMARLHAIKQAQGEAMASAQGAVASGGVGGGGHTGIGRGGGNSGAGAATAASHGSRIPQSMKT